MIQYTILTLVILLTSIQQMQAQSLDSLGLNDAPELNQYESTYFNEIFKAKRGDFSFDKKKVIFLTGTGGGSIIKKEAYFNDLVTPYLIKNSSPQTFFVLLTEEEKIQSRGYDVIILSWVKVFSKRRQAKIINKISTLSSSSDSKKAKNASQGKTNKHP